MSQKPLRSVLVYRTGHLGDTICAIPAFRLLRDWFRDYRMVLLCDVPTGGKVSAEQVIAPLGIFDAVETYFSGRGTTTLWQMANSLRKIQPDLVVILPQVRESAASLARKKRFFRWCGVDDVRGVNFPGLPHDWQPTEAVRLIQVLRAIGIRGKKMPYDIPFSEQTRSSVRALLNQVQVDPDKPFLIFCGGGKASSQLWGDERYARVLQKLHERFGLPIVAIGGRAELSRYQSGIVPRFPPLRLLPPLAMPELFDLHRLGIAYLGNDTGPMHAAAAVDCPVAVLMSARNSPGTWDPDAEPRIVFRNRTDCENCFLINCNVEGHPCMSGITEDSVLKTLVPFIERLLKGDRTRKEPLSN